MARGRARTGLLVTAFAALSAAGLVMPETAGATTTALRPLERIVLPPATVRNALPPVVTSPPAIKPVPPANQIHTKVLSVTPAQGATNVALSERVTIKLSAPPRARCTNADVDPPVAGKWWVNGNTLTFVAASGYSPWATERVAVKPPLAAPG